MSDELYPLTEVQNGGRGSGYHFSFVWVCLSLVLQGRREPPTGTEGLLRVSDNNVRSRSKRRFTSGIVLRFRLSTTGRLRGSSGK